MVIYEDFINSYLSSIKYWFRLLEMVVDRLPKTAYEMLLCLDRNGKDCRPSTIREILCETGFNFVWLQQGVGDKNLFSGGRSKARYVHTGMVWSY